MKQLTVQLTGIAPLILHSNQMVDPQNYFAKEMAKVKNKKPKTEADLERMSEIEFMAGLYLHNDIVVIPTKVQAATFVKGAMKDRHGPMAKAGVFFSKHAPLNYGKKLTPDELYANGKYTSREMVRVQTSTIVRVRPIFNEWSVDVTMDYDEDVIDKETILQAWGRAGHVVGMGDWRPQHGRFSVKVLK